MEWTPTRIRLFRDTGLCLSQPQFAKKLGFASRTIGNAERGAHPPSLAVRRALDQALEQASEIQSNRFLSALAALPETGATQDPKTRHMVSLPLTNARQLTASLDDIAQRYETLPAASLLAEAGQCHASIGLLLGHAPSESPRQELHTVAAAAAILMSQLVWDVSQRRDYDTTVAYCDEAIEHIRESGDTVAIAHAELRKGFAVLYGRAEAHNPRRGLDFTQAAAEYSRGVSDALYGLSLLHVGEAYAMLGEHRLCERAISAAEKAFTQISDDDPGASFYSPTQLGRLAGSCYLFLGHPELAEPLLDATAKDLHAQPKTRSLVLGNLALAQLRQRHLEAAAATLEEAIDLLESTRGGGGFSVVFGAVRELYPWRHEQIVHDVQDRLLTLVART
ncbi:MAG: helix-turn-helix domain-containing protein [Pseudonocardiaceae bacterium]